MSQESKGKEREEHEVVDFNAAREQRLEEKRRRTERIFFKNVLGIYCVTENDNARQLEFVDMSEDGCAFQIPFDANDPWPRDMTEIPVRIYMSQDTYIPLYLNVKNSRSCIDDGERYVRFGCEVDKTVSSYSAYLSFVSFLTAYSTHAHKDNGKTTLFYL